MRKLIHLAIVTALSSIVTFAQNDFNKIEVFGGYSLAATRSTTNSLTFKDPSGQSQTFSNLCSTQTGAMLGPNSQKFFCDRRNFNGFDGSSPHFNQFQGLFAGAFDHHGTGVAQCVDWFQELHALGAKFANPRVKIAHTERDVILQLSP